MKEEIKVPQLGESISEATVSAILKPAGSAVQMDDELLELATDKVNQVLYASQAGIFTPTVKEEDQVKIGQVIGYIEVVEKGKAAPKEKTTITEKNQPEVTLEVAPKEKQAATLEPTLEKNVTDDTKNSRSSVDIYLKELSASQIKSPEKLKNSSELPETSNKAPPERESRQKMTKIRKIIASRLVEVQNTTAMLTTFNEVDLTEVMGLREKYKESFVKTHGVRLGFMSFFVKVAVSALQAFPGVNSYIDGEDLIQRHYYAIGIAVGGAKGLVVPVVKDCDKLSFAQIEKAISDYAEKIKAGKLAADDLYGGGFTITNGGVYGSLLSTPILNPNQCAILGMHKISKRAVVIDDQIVIRQMMYLALSYDHRIIDGKEAVSFLVHIKNCLEDPTRLLLEV
ncbi:MAG: 2-oxoglutarate dehydrogenase complex dihydrolipoyllysine-residue succinyltransferase [Parachlamydiaceae bacterium]|nr:2-oxoglutarate dehydrogenase complex dihydrolipoyllysine-residue succinyltransferase [Parachlamydiaceae bacterium]